MSIKIARAWDHRTAILVTAALALLGGGLFLMTLTRAAAPPPILIEGTASRTCQQLADAYDPGSTWLELKIDPNPVGDGPFEVTDGILTVTMTNASEKEVDWSSNIGVDAVFVKGGASGSNLYVYDPPAQEATSDATLVSPGAPGNDISHVSFCYDIELRVSKTATPTFTRTVEWDIDETVSVDAWDLFAGDTGTSEYTVEVTRTGFVDGAWAVNGDITISNPHPSASATVTSVTDTVSPAINAPVTCPAPVPFTIAPGGTVTCAYSTPLPDGTNRTNTAVVVASGAIGGGTATAPVAFADPTTVLNGSVNVEDTFAGDLGSFSDSGSAAYQRTFSCDEDAGTHDHTAAIIETDQSDHASVVVSCNALEVTQDARSEFAGRWQWTIDASADKTNLTLLPGELFLVTYKVTVDATLSDETHAAVDVDECVDVSDSTFGGLGTLCAGDAPTTFRYSVSFGMHPGADETLMCGDNSHTTVADFITDDSGSTGQDTWTVNAHVSCGPGCTLSHGYWKTHSDEGPDPFDDTWDLLPDGSDTTFFLSGKTYYQTLWTSPKGNAYYLLARQYIAAELNILNGADPSAVQADFDAATGLLETWTPAQTGDLKGNDPVRQQFRSLATRLGSWNSGATGPGHCP